MSAATVLACLTMLIARQGGEGEGFVLNDQEYLETRGVNVLVFSNLYDGMFSDSKMSGIEIIHHASAVSFVSGVGAESKKVAYGSNRADFSFIAGGVVPGIVIVRPDFPENKDDWPFLWGENEYVINLAAAYLYLVQAACDLAGELSHHEPRSGPSG